MMRISWASLLSSTPGGGFANAHYLNSLQMAVTFYMHAQCGICDKRLFRLVHIKRSGIDNCTSPPKTRHIHRVHWIGDRGSVAVSFENLPSTHQSL